jgi:hypothetical protein
MVQGEDMRRRGSRATKDRRTIEHVFIDALREFLGLAPLTQDAWADRGAG